MSGLFISFEGTEGSGKSTQLRLLEEHLKKSGYSTVCVREPGGTLISEEIRHTLKHSSQNHAMAPETELLLVNASRAQLVREVIQPALAKGQVVLTDRFADSTIAYQGYGRQLALDKIAPIVQFATGSLVPDITFLLRIPVELSEQRRRSRITATQERRDRFEEQDRDFFLRVEEGYRALASAEPHRIQVIEAAASIHEIEEAIWSKVIPWLDRKSSPSKNPAG